MKARILAAVAAAALLTMLNGTILMAQEVESLPDKRVIRVDGTATITVAPDELGLTIWVRQEDPNGERAMERYHTTRQKVLDALAKSGIPKTRILESGVSFSKVTERNYENGEITREYFSASSMINIVITDFAAYPDLIVTLTSIDGVATEGVQYRASKMTDLRRQAMLQAMEDARSKAEAMAGVYGASIGQVLVISENTMNPMIPYYENSMRRMPGDGASNQLILSNEAISITASVSVTFELGE